MKENKSRIRLVAICLFVSACTIFIGCSRGKELKSTEIDTGIPETYKDLDYPVVSSGDFPPPESGERDFYKIQVLATSSLERAKEAKLKLMQNTTKTIYITNEDVLWKVQLGDYMSRKESEIERDQLRGLGWIDAWIMNYRASVTQSEMRQKEAGVPDVSEKSYYYTVQLVATSSKSKAEELFQNLLVLEISDAILRYEEDLWKIQAGTYQNYSDAGKTLIKYRKMGFADSWITKHSH